MRRLNEISEVCQQLRKWRMAGERIAFVPTMGNLHRGHLRLVEQAQKHGQRVVVSIFVNPMQFNDQRDFAAYPNTLAQDGEKLSEAGVDALFLPSTAALYPEGHEGQSRVVVPGLSDILCGEHRPGHFVGVTTVVTKLFNLVRPDVALFGEKDFQQLMVIRRMVAELCFPVEIIGIPTERESDGLAMSSRNSYLTVEQRQQASLLFRVLTQAKSQLQLATHSIESVEIEAIEVLQTGGFKVEYFTVCNAKDLSKAGGETQDLVIVAAAWLGKARLIDNIGLNLG